MGWFILPQIFSALLELIILSHRSSQANELEILLLRRQQLALVDHTKKLGRVSRVEKLALAVLVVKLKTRSGQTVRELSRMIRIVQPETMFKWHSDLVCSKWTHHQQGVEGSPRTE